MVKQVRILEVSDKLPLIHAIKSATRFKTESCVNLVNRICDTGSILLISDSYINVKQWETIAEECKDIMKWEYVK